MPVADDPRLTALIERLEGTPDEERRIALYAAIEDYVSEEALVLPVFVPHRVAVVRRDRPRVGIDHDLYRLAVSR